MVFAMYRKEIFVFALMFPACLVHTRKHELTWTRDQAFNDVIKVKGYPHIEVPANNVIRCASLCTSSSSCFSFFFLPTTKQCFMNEMVFTQPDGGESSPADCSFDGYVWLRDQRMCVKAYRRGKSFKSAYQRCLKDGSRLVVLDTEAKKLAVEKYFAKKRNKEWRAYVGGARKGAINATRRSRWNNILHPLYWLNGVKVPTSEVKGYWSDKNPSNTGGWEACLEITWEGWNDVVCSEVLPYICEKVRN